MDSPQKGQAIYSSKDVAKSLNIQESTLRKYCLLLEQEKYHFLKNEQGHRGFVDSDIIVLRKIIELKNKNSDITLKQATKSVVAWKKGNDITDLDTPKERYDVRYDVRYNNLLEEFKTFRKQQESFNKELIDQLNKQQQYINTKLEERDKNLMIAMKESMENKKEIATSKEKAWWKFWEK